jgi:[acyl-carrier-protein] S-malonyltransferase
VAASSEFTPCRGYTALTAASCLDFNTALRLVESRGKLMQQAVPEGSGAMAAILGLSDEDVRAACAQARQSDVVEAVNYNAPGQVVIAGHRIAVERAVAAAKASGAKRAIVLPVSVPSHCALMQEAATALHARLQEVEIFAPQIPVVNNAQVSVETEPQAIRHALAKQLYNPVRWVESIAHIAAQGVSLFIECGPGKVLSGLNKRIAKEAEHLSLDAPAALERALRAAE